MIDCSRKTRPYAQHGRHAHKMLKIVFSRTGPGVIKHFSWSVQFIVLINVKMPTRIDYLFLSFEPEFSINFDYFKSNEQLKFYAQLS